MAGGARGRRLGEHAVARRGRGGAADEASRDALAAPDARGGAGRRPPPHRRRGAVLPDRRAVVERGARAGAGGRDRRHLDRQRPDREHLGARLRQRHAQAGGRRPDDPVAPADADDARDHGDGEGAGGGLLGAELLRVPPLHARSPRHPARPRGAEPDPDRAQGGQAPAALPLSR